MKINKNLGVLDRILRIGISSAIIYFGFFDNPLITDPTAGIILGLFGVANMIVALVGNCPMYTLIDFSTYHEST